MINLTSALSKGLQKKDSWGEKKLHVSDLGIAQNIDNKDRKCPRQFWLRYNGFEKKALTPGTQLMFEQGHALEKKAIRLLKKGLPKEYRVMATQMDITAGLPGNFTGRLDMIISHEDKFLVIDFKTRRGNAFRYSNDIKPTNKYQIGGYLYAISKLFNTKKLYGAVLEIDREGQNFARDFHFQYTPEFEQKIISAFQYVKEIAETDNPPEVLKPEIKRNKNKGADSIVAKLPWQCRYCNYRSMTCDGAIPPEFDDNLGKVCGHIKDGEFVEKVEGISEYVEVE